MAVQRVSKSLRPGRDARTTERSPSRPAPLQGLIASLLFFEPNLCLASSLVVLDTPNPYA